jgi:hypothetical protein
VPFTGRRLAELRRQGQPDYHPRTQGALDVPVDLADHHGMLWQDRRMRRVLILVSALAAGLGSGCGQTEHDPHQQGGDGGATAGSAQNGGAGGAMLSAVGGTGVFVSGGSAGAGGPMVPDETGMGGSSSISVPSPPVVHCSDVGGAGGSGEAGAATGEAGGEASWDDTCAPPPSQCANNLDLVYYSDGACSKGRCVWTATVTHCEQLCSVNGCETSITAK